MGHVNQRVTIERIFENDDLRISYSGDPEGERAILCFTGIGFKMGPNLPPEQFIRTLARYDQTIIYVTDLARSWYNNFDVEDVIAPIAPLIEGKRLATIGNSMGGFGAIWITRHLPVETTVAFGPQFSVKPEIVPHESRWKVLRQNIMDWKVPSLEGHFVDRTRYYTISGPVDRAHFRRFPEGQNITHCVIKGANHNPALVLTERGLLGDLVTECLNHNDIVAWLCAHGIEAQRANGVEAAA